MESAGWTFNKMYLNYYFILYVVIYCFSTFAAAEGPNTDLRNNFLVGGEFLIPITFILIFVLLHWKNKHNII